MIELSNTVAVFGRFAQLVRQLHEVDNGLRKAADSNGVHDCTRALRRRCRRIWTNYALMTWQSSIYSLREYFAALGKS